MAFQDPLDVETGADMGGENLNTAQQVPDYHDIPLFSSPKAPNQLASLENFPLDVPLAWDREFPNLDNNGDQVFAHNIIDGPLSGLEPSLSDTFEYNSEFSNQTATTLGPYSSNLSFTNGDLSYTDPFGPTPELTEGSTSTSNLANDYTTDRKRWHALETRSRAADQAFLYGVSTTGVYCRPSCAARRASRRHIRYFDFPPAIEEAEAAGFRACKRCKPELLGTANSGILGIIKSIQSVIADTSDFSSNERKVPLKLDDLAEIAELSRFHFHRQFKITTQVTPADFIHACRCLYLQDALSQRRSFQSNTSSTAGPATAIAGDAGWSSRTARKALGGIAPAAFAKGAPSTDVEYCSASSSPVGPMCVAFSIRGENASVHTVALGQSAENEIRLRFLVVQPSVKANIVLQQCLEALEERCKDRDSQLPGDVLPWLWRARVLLNFGDYWRKQFE